MSISCVFFDLFISIVFICEKKFSCWQKKYINVWNSGEKKWGRKNSYVKMCFFCFCFCSLLKSSEYFIYFLTMNTCRKCKTTLSSYCGCWRTDASVLTADVHETVTSHPGNNVSKYKMCLLVCWFVRWTDFYKPRLEDVSQPRIDHIKSLWVSTVWSVSGDL